MADLTLEQSESQRRAAESEAEKLRTQLEQERKRADDAEAMAALRISAGFGGEMAALNRKLSALSASHEDIKTKVEQSYGEDGVAVNAGVAHGSGDAGRTSQSQQGSVLAINVSVFGQIFDVGMLETYVRATS